MIGNVLHSDAFMEAGYLRPARDVKEYSMRSILFAALSAAVLLPSSSLAQSASEIRKNEQELEKGRQEVKQALRRGDIEEAREDMQELREDRREAEDDWRSYREKNADVFRLGAYSGPTGYTYSPVTVGRQFEPTYLSERYWINEPATFRLSKPGENQRWVRYGNDVMLIDVRTGSVVRFFSDFFL